MSEQDFQAVDNRRSIAMYVVGTVVAIFMVVSGYTNYKLSERLGQTEERQAAAEQVQQKIRGDVSTATTSAQALAQRYGFDPPKDPEQDTTWFFHLAPRT